MNITISWSLTLFLTNTKTYWLKRDLNSHLRDSGPPLYPLSYSLFSPWRLVVSFYLYKCTVHEIFSRQLNADPWEDVQCFNSISESSSERSYMYINIKISWSLTLFLTNTKTYWLATFRGRWSDGKRDSNSHLRALPIVVFSPLSYSLWAE